MKARARAAIIGFGRRVREHRLAAGISQSELGRRSRVSLDFISRIERGNSNPSLETMVLVACALDCNVAGLLAPTTAAPYLTLRAEDAQRAREALAMLGSIVTPRNRTRRTSRKAI